MTTKISTSNIRTTTLENLGGSPTISNVQITDSSYTVLDDTAISLDGGYIKITGTKFASGCTVVVNRTSATSVTFVSATEVRAQLPALVAGTYVMYVINPDSSVAIRVNAITYSATPTWVTGSTLPNGISDQTISINLNASGAATYSVQAGSTLPTGLTLASNGLLSGTVAGLTQETTYNFNVVATDAELQDSPRSFSITITAGDPNFANTVLLLSGNANTFVKDSSSNNFPVAVVGDTRPSTFSPHTPGRYSVYFDTKTDYISVPATTALTTFTGDFTLEAWIYPTDTSVGNWKFWDSRQDGGTANPMVFGLTSITTGQGKLEYFNGNYNQGTGVVYYNRWTHVAFVRSGSTLTYYVDGVAGGTSTISGTQTGTATSNPVIIGTKDSGVGGYGIVGYVSNLRMVNGTAVYTSNFTPSTEPLTAITNTVLLTCQSNRYIDNSANAYTMLPNGVGINSLSPFTPDSSTSTFGSAYFDGTGDYLTVPYNSAFDFGTGDFTVEFWTYKTTDAASSFFSGAANGSLDLAYTSDNYLRFGRVNTAWDTVVGYTLNANQWYHIAFVKQSGVAKVFVNGTLAGSGNNTNSYTLQSGALRLNVAGDGSRQMVGYISNLRAVKGTAVYTTNFTPPTAPLTAVSGTILLTLKSNVGVNNNYILDYSNVNNTVTRFGNATQGSFSPYSAHNWSNYFDGDGDYLTVPGNAAFNLNSGSWTIECWFYTTASKLATIVSQGGSTWRIQQNGTTIVYNASTDRITGSIAASLNTWNHVALVSNSGTGTITLYINGSSAGSTNAYPASSNTDSVYIGINPESSAWAYQGYISNLRVVKGTAVYTTNFTPPTTTLTAISGTSLLTCADNRFIDKSSNAYGVTVNGNTRVTNFTVFKPTSEYLASQHGGSMYFDGTGDYLTVPYSTTAFDWWTSNYTIEAWVYPTSFTGWSYSDGANIKPTLIGNKAVSTTEHYWGFGLNTSGNVYFAYYNGASQGAGTSSAATLNAWNHIAFVKSGTSLVLYLNGVGTSIGSFSGNSTSGTGQPLTIGVGNSAYINGYVSNLRIVKGTAVYTSNFTPPASPVLPVQGTTLLLNGTSSAIVDATSRNVLETVGDAKITNALSKFGGSSIYLDGNGDYLSIPDSLNIRLGSSNFTMEGWFWFDGNQDSFSLFQKATSYQLKSDANRWVFQTPAANIFVASFSLAHSQWLHIALVRNGSTTTLYINGSAYTNGSSADAPDSTSPLQIGSGEGTFKGYMQDVRITRGIARYTTNFTPPATAHMLR